MRAKSNTDSRPNDSTQRDRFVIVVAAVSAIAGLLFGYDTGAFGVPGASPPWTSSGKLRLPDLMK
jgi:hypothetical protein